MKFQIKPVALGLAAALALTACNDTFEDLAVNPSQPSLGPISTPPKPSTRP